MCQSFSDLEIIVVCDGQDEHVRQLSQTFHGYYPLRWIFHPNNRGLPAARNTGAREAEGDIVLFLDDDVTADSELVAIHMRHHETADSFARGAHRPRT